MASYVHIIELMLLLCGTLSAAQNERAFPKGWSPFKTLGLSESTRLPNKRDLKRAHRKASMQWHPDKCKEDAKKCEKKMSAVNVANEILQDKKEFQNWLNQKNGAPPGGGGGPNPFGGAGGNPFGAGGNPFGGGGGGNPFGGMNFDFGGGGNPFGGMGGGGKKSGKKGGKKAGKRGGKQAGGMGGNPFGDMGGGGNPFGDMFGGGGGGGGSNPFGGGGGGNPFGDMFGGMGGGGGMGGNPFGGGGGPRQQPKQKPKQKPKQPPRAKPPPKPPPAKPKPQDKNWKVVKTTKERRGKATVHSITRETPMPGGKQMKVELLEKTCYDSRKDCSEKVIERWRRKRNEL